MRVPTFENAIDFARDLIRIPGLSGNEAAVADRVLDEFRALGFDDAWSDEVGNVFGRIRGRGEGPTVMLCSHLDVVDVGDAEDWEYPPFEGVVADGFLHGRGAMDIKGPLALQTYAAARFVHDRPAGALVVGHTVFEERGGWGIRHFLEHGDFRPDVLVIGEATNGDLCIGHRGRAEIVVELIGRAGHASAPERALNPLDGLGAVLAALRDFAAQLPADPILGASTAAPTRVETLPRSNNVIPERARITLDWRVLPTVTAESAAPTVEAFLRERVELDEGLELRVRLGTERQRSYTGLEQDREVFTSGFLMDPDAPIVRAAAAAIAEATGSEPTVRPWTFATDGGYARGVFGIPTLGFAPGQERYAHTARERLDLDDARRVFDAYPALLRALFEQVADETRIGVDTGKGSSKPTHGGGE